MKKQTPSWSIRGRLSKETQNPNPGPGTYSPEKRFKSPNFSVGQSQRSPLGKDGSAMPGPGSYKTSLEMTKGSTFGTSCRKEDSRSLSPGPGTYVVTPGVGGPQFTLKPRLNPLKKFGAPGPGEYFPNSQFKWSASPTWRIGRDERKGVRGNGMPGPGTYYNSADPSGPRWRFSNSGRSTIKTDYSPGPAAYNI